MITAEMLRRLAPRALPDYVSALLNGSETFERWGVTTPVRMAHFLAQVCHETGGLTIVRENMNYTASRIRQVWPTRAGAIAFAGNPRALANSVYGSRMGNERNGTADDDGYRYRGGGLIQLTGRDSYAAAGAAIGVDLANKPELIEDAHVSLQAACWEFSKFLKFCDMGERGLRAVCNGINRGNALSKLDPIGWADRQLWYKRAVDALGAVQPVEDVLNLGDQGPIVKAFQERLTALGYAVGRVDGIFGSRMRAAVLAFQAENEIATDGVIGAQTRAALNSENARPMPLGERATETAADLRASGSEIANLAQAVKTTAIIGGGTAAATGATQSATAEKPLDLISGTKDVVTEISTWKAITNAIGETFAWATSHWWIFAIVFTFVLWRWGRQIEVRRLLDHQLGLHLGK